MLRASVLATTLLLVSCDAVVPPEVQMAERMRPDPEYRLSPSERQILAPAFDPDAVEKLMAYYPDPAKRDEALKEFLDLSHGVAQGKVQITSVRYLGNEPDVIRAVEALSEESPFTGRPEELRDSPPE